MKMVENGKLFMRIITVEDIRDIYLKGIQGGSKFILSKFNFSGKKRTKSSFNETEKMGSNWWIIPSVKKRWNFLITGDEDLEYEPYISSKYFENQPIKMLSIGSGVCSHELEFARLNPNCQITCIDFSEKLLQLAEKKSMDENLKNINFLAKDIRTYQLPKNHYDVVLFHSSLHHFDNIKDFLERIKNTLSVGGKLIIHEYVGPNRIQYGKQQLKAINECLKLIDRPFRKMFRTNIYKDKYFGSGFLRMYMSDPSECVDSERIIPDIHSKFNVIEEKNFGGNILMPVLKDISHHFVELDDRKKEILQNIFDFEDNYLKNHKSDFVFGVYEKK